MLVERRADQTSDLDVVLDDVDDSPVSLSRNFRIVH
jgi:hypothetical protein